MGTFWLTFRTWLRLSPESVKSERFLLENGSQFKLGGNMTYECQKTCTNRKTGKEKSDKCQICKVTEKNCIFLPCKHNICCLKCAQMNEISHCTVCGSTVNDIMKIFKVWKRIMPSKKVLERKVLELEWLNVFSFDGFYLNKIYFRNFTIFFGSKYFKLWMDS